MFPLPRVAYVSSLLVRDSPMIRTRIKFAQPGNGFAIASSHAVVRPDEARQVPVWAAASYMCSVALSMFARGSAAYGRRTPVLQRHDALTTNNGDSAASRVCSIAADTFSRLRSRNDCTRISVGACHSDQVLRFHRLHLNTPYLLVVHSTSAARRNILHRQVLSLSCRVARTRLFSRSPVKTSLVHTNVTPKFQN
jgi:hypothetical protein